jgi:hypothetical protein
VRDARIGEKRKREERGRIRDSETAVACIGGGILILITMLIPTLRRGGRRWWLGGPSPQPSFAAPETALGPLRACGDMREQTKVEERRGENRSKQLETEISQELYLSPIRDIPRSASESNSNN